MQDIAKKMSKEIAFAVIKELPGGDLILNIAENSLDHLISNIFKADKIHPIVQIANSTVEAILNTPDLDESNPGAAMAACLNVKESIKKSGITFQKLIELNFDSERVSVIILESRFQDYDNASNTRRHIWDRGVKQFSLKVCQETPKIPEVQPLMMVHILRQQSEILERLSSLKT